MTAATRPRRAVVVQKWVVNPLMRPLVRCGIATRAYALVETTGRRTGKTRVVPVGGHLDGDTYWLVAEHGRGSHWVRNLEADPAVRVRVGRRWHDGTAHLLDDDDPLGRRRAIDKANGLIGRLDGAHFVKNATDPLTIRVDLAPPED